MIKNKISPDFLTLAKRLLQWYEAGGRDLPWRQTQDPYRIWLSEIILQQTRVAQGLPYYLRFVSSFPAVQDLARASQDEVLLHWKGLGYYSRALNLHRAAKKITGEFDGQFPSTFEGLKALPGIGPYTAAAIGSLCFGLPTPAIDGNLYRVLARFFADATDIASSGAWKHFEKRALELMPADRPGDFNQAMMDLGASLCSPRNPDCSACPLQAGCQAFALQRQEDFPVKSKKQKVTEIAFHYQFVTDGQRFVTVQRDGTGIWKHLWEFPSAPPDPSRAEVVQSHLLSHRRLQLYFYQKNLSPQELDHWAHQASYHLCSDPSGLAFPKPIQNFLDRYFSGKPHQGSLEF